MLVTIGRYLDPWEAQVLRARLEAEGVPATLMGDQHAVANWPIATGLGGVALQVPEAFLTRAREVIDAYEAGELAADLAVEHPEAVDRCPRCDGTDLARSVPLRQRLLTMLTFFIAGAPFPTRASRLRCRNCGHRWRYGD